MAQMAVVLLKGTLLGGVVGEVLSGRCGVHSLDRTL